MSILRRSRGYGYALESLKCKEQLETTASKAALQNASSVASLMLTTEVMITDMPEEKGGGMGGMY